MVVTRKNLFDNGNYTYPDDYPELGTKITVTGVFGTYLEDGIEYCLLSDAVMEVN